jgi:hypothetical protein
MAKQTFTTGQVLTANNMTSLQQTAMGGGSATAKTASYVLVAADAGTTVIMNSGSATTITVNTSLFAAGDTVFIVNQGAGVCTITAGTATVSTAGSLAMGQNETGQLYFLSTSAAIFTEYTQAAGSSSALTLIVAQTIGTSVSSVTVTNAFSTTYDDYLLIVSGGTAAGSGTLTLKLGATTTDYYETQIYATYTSSSVSNFSQSNVGAFSFGRVSSAALNGYGIVSSPFLAKRTVLWGTSSATVTGDSSGTTTGMLNNATSYTDLVIASSFAMTGGTIRVYGYQKS